MAFSRDGIPKRGGENNERHLKNKIRVWTEKIREKKKQPLLRQSKKYSVHEKSLQHVLPNSTEPVNPEGDGAER